MVDVEILGQVITHQYGTLKTGDVLRTSAEFAKHLVEDCGAAKYRLQDAVDAVPETVSDSASAVETPAADPIDQPPASTPTRGRRSTK